MADIQRLFNIFLNEYAVQFGVPLPGRLPNHGNVKVTLLPFDKANDVPHIVVTCAPFPPLAHFHFNSS
jgi:hypothetical protein